MVPRLERKVALITGAAGGMGASHARLFTGEGAAVVLSDIVDGPGERLADGLRREGLRAIYAHLDVARAEDWETAVDSAEREFGSLDVLVNNAGVVATAGAV